MATATRRKARRRSAPPEHPAKGRKRVKVTSPRRRARRRSALEWPLVLPGDEPKSGCRWCPLLPWSTDFERIPGEYNRDAEKLRAKEPDGHTVTNRCVQESDWNEVDILFVGEAPGRDEDKQGKPFVGISGKILRDALAEMRIDPARVGISNTVRCRPPRNKKPGKTIVQSCTPQLVREIKARKPKVICALGNVPLEYLTGQTGITTFTGRVLDCTLPGLEHHKVVACLHPAYIARMDHEMIRFIEAMEVVESLVNDEYTPLPGSGEYHVLYEFGAVMWLLDRIEAEATSLAYDTETGSLNWWQTDFDALLCHSFSFETGVGYTIPWDHRDSPWREGRGREKEREIIARRIKAILENPEIEKLLQNAKFDAKHARAHLDGCEIYPYRDTMLTHLVLDERQGTHGLKELAYTYTGLGGYEKELDDYIARHPEANPKRGGSYANVPGDILFTYAAMDADVTFRVDDGLLAEPEYQENPALGVLAEQFFPELSRALTDMEFAGAQIDPDAVRRMDRHYRAVMERTSSAIARLPKVRKYARWREKQGKERKFNPGSHQQLRDVLFGAYKCKPVELTDGGLEKLSLRWEKRVRAWRERRSGRKPEFREVVREAIERREWEHFSTKADVLHEIAAQGNELAPLILEYRAAETLHGTFVKPLMDQLDVFGRIHGNFNIHGTVTGRLSSNGPNLQNIPNKGGGLIKSAYVSRFGDEGMIGQMDYSQVELRVAGSFFDEPTMVQAYIDGADLHLLTALDITGLSERQYKSLSAPQQKEARTQAKRINFGILYGGGPPALQTALKKDGVFLSIDECKALIQRYFEVRPKLARGIKKLEASVKKTGYLTSFTGRRRRVPEVASENDEIVARALRQSVNFPIQNGASEMTLMSLVLIWREMRARGYRSQIILSVHDSIIFDLHRSEAVEVMCMAKEIMENLPSLSDQVMPGLDWSWLKCPIVADGELGPNWAALQGVNLDALADESHEPETDLWGCDDKGDWYVARDPETMDELDEVIEWKMLKVA